MTCLREGLRDDIFDCLTYCRRFEHFFLLCIHTALAYFYLLVRWRGHNVQPLTSVSVGIGVSTCLCTMSLDGKRGKARDGNFIDGNLEFIFGHAFCRVLFKS